jgi:hypothetical protein
VPDKVESSRLEQYEADGTEIKWPEVTLQYLIDYFFECGACLSTGMGNVPITWQELKAWQDQTGIELQPWEARILKQASRAYVTQAQESTKPNCPPPGRVVEADPLKQAQKIKSIFR